MHTSRRAHCSGLTKSKGHAKFSQRICRITASHGEPRRNDAASSSSGECKCDPGASWPVNVPPIASDDITI